MDEWEEILAEFVEETSTNLRQMETDLTCLNRDPRETESLSRIHRTFHSLKGLTGFFGFQQMGQLAQLGEALFHGLIHGEQQYDAKTGEVLANVRLALVVLLGDIERTGEEVPRDIDPLAGQLDALMV